MRVFTLRFLIEKKKEEKRAPRLPCLIFKRTAQTYAAGVPVEEEEKDKTREHVRII